MVAVNVLREVNEVDGRAGHQAPVSARSETRRVRGREPMAVLTLYSLITPPTGWRLLPRRRGKRRVLTLSSWTVVSLVGGGVLVSLGVGGGVLVSLVVGGMLLLLRVGGCVVVVVVAGRLHAC